MANFATRTDLAVRLGRNDDTELTTAQQAQADLLLTLATGIVTDAVGKDTAWADALTPVPGVLRAVTIEMVARVMHNPMGVRSEMQQLGSAQHSVSFADGAHGLFLTDDEARLCRRAVLGPMSGSVQLGSLFSPDPTVT